MYLQLYRTVHIRVCTSNWSSCSWCVTRDDVNDSQLIIIFTNSQYDRTYQIWNHPEIVSYLIHFIVDCSVRTDFYFKDLGIYRPISKNTLCLFILKNKIVCWTFCDDILSLFWILSFRNRSTKLYFCIFTFIHLYSDHFYLYEWV